MARLDFIYLVFQNSNIAAKATLFYIFVFCYIYCVVCGAFLFFLLLQECFAFGKFA